MTLIRKCRGLLTLLLHDILYAERSSDGWSHMQQTARVEGALLTHLHQ